MPKLLPLFLLGLVACERPSPIFATRIADYLEDERTGRVLAEVRADVLRQPGGPHLQLALRAIGPRVDPVPGYEGVRGANRITARELGRLFEDSRLRVVTRAANREVVGSARVTRRGRVPVRATKPDGRVDLDALTPAEYPLEVVIDSGPLASGDCVTEVFVDGVPRLRVRLSIGAAGTDATITDIESLGGHDLRF